MLQNCPLETSCAHFPGWGQKCSKTVLWKLPGLTFRAGARNPSKHYSGSLLGSLFGLGAEMLQNSTLEASWAHFPGWGQKSFKAILWKTPGLTFRAGPASLVTRTLYVLHRCRAFHEMWCPKVVGRDSWVREATGVSVQRIPPKNWGKKLVVVRKRFAHENGTSP